MDAAPHPFCFIASSKSQRKLFSVEDKFGDANEV
jgi:hypothetical protein